MQKPNSCLYLKIVFIICLCSFGLICCKSGPNPVTEEEAYNAFNEVIVDDTLVFSEICEQTSSNISVDESIKKYVTEEEFEYLKQQTKKVLPKKWKPNRIIYFHGGYKKGDFVKLQKDCSNSSRYSFPILTPDRKKLLIRFESLSTFLGGSSANYLYEKKNGKWKLIATLNAIIS